MSFYFAYIVENYIKTISKIFIVINVNNATKEHNKIFFIAKNVMIAMKGNKTTIFNVINAINVIRNNKIYLIAKYAINK